MKKIIILIPVYNDWDSLKKLINEINKNIKDQNGFLFKCLIINDASTLKQPKLVKPNNLVSLKILNMKENKGHARCNAFGLKYASEKEDFDYIIVMDGDGEDRPEELQSLTRKIQEYPDNSVVARRIKRSEGFLFKFLYELHKLITLIFTGKKIDFGNYSCLTKKDVETLVEKKSLWASYSGTVKKYLKKLRDIKSIRGSRYFGPSKMSFFNLLIHSFSIIAVFKYQVFIRSILIILLLIYLETLFGVIMIFFQVMIVIFNLIIFLVSLREKKIDLSFSQSNLDNIEIISH